MSPGPQKRPKPNVNLQSLASTDRQVLERAATLLNKSLAQLLEGPVEESPSDSTAHGLPTPQMPRSQVTGAAGIFPTHPHGWLAGPQYEQLGDSLPGAYSTLPGQSRRGPLAELDPFGAQPWQDLDMISAASARASNLRHSLAPNTTPSLQQMHMSEHQVLGRQQSGWSQPGALSGPSAGTQVHVHAETNEVYGADSDESSDVSDHDGNLLDTQPWETVQITSVSTALANADSSDSDFLWLEGPDASAEDQQTAQPDALANCTQLARTERSAKERELTKQQSRRPFLNETLRNETSNTRKLKACVRCRMQKIRVSGVMSAASHCAHCQ
jgi:hypothetical protein